MGLFAALLLRKSETLEQNVQAQLAKLHESAGAQRGWQERAVAELLGPLAIQLDRTQRAFSRWKTNHVFREIKIIREGNMAIRDTLLRSPHLIPPPLLDDANLLLEHLDRWLDAFERARAQAEPDLEAPFVFAGPAAYPFPRAAEQRFKAAYRTMWDELYRPES
jgi:hypothetical protein